MLVKATGENNFILLIDILGFSNYCKQRNEEEIYSLINEVVNNAKEIEDNSLGYKVLCFSDTIILFQKENLPVNQAFNDIYSIASLLFTTLLSRKIPIRGAITFGSFTVKMNTRNDTNLFYGKALIEAHELEETEKSLSISIAQSAIDCLGDDKIKYLVSSKIIISKGGKYLLNPFYHIRGSVYSLKNELISDLDYLVEINAIKYIMDMSKQNISNAIQEKYANTISLLLDIFTKELYPDIRNIIEEGRIVS